ncbi:MBL fold metallo-hydrolase [Leptospira interrogans]|uniref:MBL fold metallo-hydrolase n=2 Tax=Leptospira interrogans TaxID=173 RepID=A0AAP9WGP3_LEPIR|nr:MBL fold metallo-hydrolase [Leptospira interrogans]EMG12962.1 4Fe-4S single cluster domain protein [Leptospira interrogans serovar Grippotyphosa str. LT2186]KAA1291046.1 MBL fold metallo-hydrolase [Leptospira interrogans serovar Geyaweera]EJP18148.1 4Fe-4S single cluster domain protein [Leptospira interrogans str. FPW2026]EKR43566.1 4Fe-4S single cluster domain protein [Leptospira interrogans serovar Grippotyphosa str. UI 08368]EMN84757.1 4Fe-4S single cluster domain protein [Leptospira int
MANQLKKRPENQEGNFYVDSTCIDCETCRIVAPKTFAEKNGGSYVWKQPEIESEKIAALRALIACPTTSIGTINRIDLKEAKETFPSKIEENVYYCGYHSKDSFGAFSYLILRENGNILVDSPRFVSSLADKIESLGGIRYHFLTHQDDVADHQKFKEKFGCDRIIHENDLKSLPSAEIVLKGEKVFELDNEVKMIPVPGHTQGHSVLLYKNRFLFTGDHLAYDPLKDRLIAFKNVCWYSWQEQINSMKKLKNYSFEWVLPGHGYPVNKEQKIMLDLLKSCIVWMETR